MTDGPRSLSSWARLVEEPALLEAMSPGERRELRERLRDRFFALSATGSTRTRHDDRAGAPAMLGRSSRANVEAASLAEERPSAAGSTRTRHDDALFRGLVERVEPEPVPCLQGLSISYHPTARHKAVRFVEADLLDPAVRSLFARPSSGMPHLAAVFVDPEELSFRTFENILPLDRLFEGTALEVTLGDRVLHGRHDGVHAYTFAAAASEATRAALQRLDGLDLYVPPLNAGSRGGKRFVFHSARLAEALTEAVREAMPKRLMASFSHVNPVFRCNRFEPGDAPFHSHVDTPYHDAARDHVSRYTLLLYLTGGAGAPVLRLDGAEDAVTIDAVEPMTAVVFEQRFEHEGAAFARGRKVFLRTELVFEDPTVVREPGIAEVFSKACYMTGESVFAPELERYAHECYDRAASAHWRGLQEAGPAEPFVHKQFRGAHFVANGYDSWFPKGALSLQECAALTLLDYFNCTVGGAAFRKQCTSEVLQGSATDPAWIDEVLRPFAGARPEPLFARMDKDALFPPPEAPDPAVCCPFHAWERFDPTRQDEIVDLYRRAQDFGRARVLPAPILMMGQEVFLDPDRFVVEGGRIHVLADQGLAPVNFAACWNAGGSPPNYLDVDVTVQALHVLVPPILFAETEGCWHLMFDFFRNGWMVSHRPATVPIPRIRDIGPEDYGEADEYENFGNPWIDAVPADLATPAPRRGRRGPEPWWAWDTALIRELFGEAGRDDG